MPNDLPRTNFSDVSQIILGSQNQWISTRRGEQNSGATIVTDKFRKSLLIFAAIGVQCKSRRVMAKRTIDSDTQIENLACFEIDKNLDDVHGPFESVLQQEGASWHTSRKPMQ
jgi:hypothetical protein